jgi:hypothetical protein
MTLFPTSGKDTYNYNIKVANWTLCTVVMTICNSSIFFHEHAGELRIFVLREKERSNYKTSHTLDHGEG